jgi:hypothetical protein
LVKNQHHATVNAMKAVLTVVLHQAHVVKVTVAKAVQLAVVRVTMPHVALQVPTLVLAMAHHAAHVVLLKII